MSLPVLVLRPQPGADETASRLRNMGLEPVVAPLMRVEPLDWVLPEPMEFDALAITSQNALRHGGAGLDNLVHLPVYAVGERTAAMAQSRGFTVERVEKKGLVPLFDHIIAAGHQRVLRPCGQDHIPTPPKAPQCGVLVEKILLYRTATCRMPDAARTAMAGENVALLHSATVAEALARAIKKAGLVPDQTHLVAMSERVAKAAGSGWASVSIAREPSEAALLAQAATLCLDNSD